jgi:hypothetical protein
VILRIAIKRAKAIGSKQDHPKDNRSVYRKRGRVPRTQIYKNTTPQVLIPKRLPPKNKSLAKVLISSKAAYSARKNSTKGMALYSVICPATSSLSASGRSKGVRFVSAKALTKNTKTKGNKGTANQSLCCYSDSYKYLRELIRKAIERTEVLRLSS